MEPTGADGRKKVTAVFYEKGCEGSAEPKPPAALFAGMRPVPGALPPRDP